MTRSPNARESLSPPGAGDHVEVLAGGVEDKRLSDLGTVCAAFEPMPLVGEENLTPVKPMECFASNGKLPLTKSQRR